MVVVWPGCTWPLTVPNTFLLGRPEPWSKVLVVIGLNPLEEEEVRPESRPEPNVREEPTGTLATLSALLLVTMLVLPRGLVITPATGEP